MKVNLMTPAATPIESSTALAIECSAGVASAAVSHQGQLVSEKTIEAPHGHAAWMIPLAQDAVAEAGLTFQDLTHILAGRGPGSFTGIRVALAGAKGLALSLGIHAIGLSSLAALAASITASRQAQKNAVLAIIDTRRGSLFFQAFDAHGKSRSDIIDGQPEDAAALIKASSESWCLAGHGADAIRARCPDHDITVAEKTSPDAHGLILQFSAMQAQHIALDDDHLEPLYLAAPILGPKKSAPKTAEKNAGKIEASS